MNHQEEHIISCPYCGENINVLIDCTYDTQEYIEDCQVCCRPITFQVQHTGHSIQVNVRHENE
ncbi:MAG: CPXCG motif-containing cysteine-rich protein [Gammaproteobacteria bacterium]|nr:CPXCG motif-containing cysteine-rich protein [Gammaproteobacteria bacterium]